MRILFITHPNLYKTKGGDLVQALETANAIRFYGHEVEIITSDQFDESKHVDFDIYHFFNAQYMSSTEVIKIFDAKDKHNIPLAISTIYWDQAETEYASTCIKSFFSQDGNNINEDSFLQALSTKTLALNGEGGKKFVYSRYKPITESKNEQFWRLIFKEADIFLPNSYLEAQNVQHSLLLPNIPFKVVTNAVNAEKFSKKIEKHPLIGKEPYVLSVARKDDRKNLILIAEAVKQLDYRWIVIGAEPFKEYMDILRKRKSKKTILIDKLEQKEVASFYQHAHVHVNASFCETPSLSSLEAGLSGACNLVVGNRSAEIEYFKEYAYYCDPFDFQSIKVAIQTAFENHAKDTSRRDLLKQMISGYNWYAAARQTIEAYNMIKRW